MTPLHLASRNNHVEVAKLLTSAGAKLDIKDEEGKVSIYYYSRCSKLGTTCGNLIFYYLCRKKQIFVFVRLGVKIFSRNS